MAHLKISETQLKTAVLQWWRSAAASVLHGQQVTGNRRHESQSLKQIQVEAKCVSTVLCDATLEVLTAVLLKIQVFKGCDAVR